VSGDGERGVGGGKGEWVSTGTAMVEKDGRKGGGGGGGEWVYGGGGGGGGGGDLVTRGFVSPPPFWPYPPPPPSTHPPAHCFPQSPMNSTCRFGIVHTITAHTTLDTIIKTI
jgi:hypothetical protein